jgi:hypothetical protein
MIRNLILIIALCVGINYSYSQNIATFTIELLKETNKLEVPVSINLDEVTFLPDSSLTLFKVQDNHKTLVPFQVEYGEHRILNWIIGKESNQQKKYTFELVQGSSEKSEKIKAIKNDGKVLIRSEGKNLLCYNFKTVYPPKGIDSAYKRSGFIHPLWSPHGQILTRIQPPDHYHHYGVWNPWTHVLFEGDTVDFWNLAKQQGTVRFANFVSVTNGPVFSEYKTLHEHVVFKNDGREKVALNELESVKVYKPEGNQDYYFVDIEIDLNCATESPVLLLKYRYGGLGWRTTEAWNNANSEVLTSEGNTRKDADGSKARWCIVQGEINNDYAGILMMSYPTNYNYPEPLRIWPEDQNGRGDMFANFSPTKDRDWLLEPGKKYVLKYRFLVFNNHLTNEQAESAWQYFANQSAINIIKK